MEECQKLYTEWKKPYSEEYMLYGSIFMKFWKRQISSTVGKKIKTGTASGGKGGDKGA